MITVDLPRRRLAVFTDILRGEYWVMVHGDDIERAEKWGGFVKWIGQERPPFKLKNKGVRK